MDAEGILAGLFLGAFLFLMAMGVSHLAECDNPTAIRADACAKLRKITTLVEQDECMKWAEEATDGAD